MIKHYLSVFILIACIILAIGILNAVDNPTLSSRLPTESSAVSTTPPQTTERLSSSPPKPIHVSDSQALAHYEQGLKLYYQRQFPEALRLLNQALVIDPQCYEALNAKGATLAFQGNYDQGLALIQQALNLNPSFVYGNFNLGLVNELAGRWDAAVSAYQKALQLDNRDTWSYYGIASIYGRLGKIDKVLEYLQPAIALDPDVKEVARGEHDFAPVREDPRFQALVKP
ncbi:tetratricopeptide repeat protein [Desulfosporosinus sp. Sb-LF]|uniref:tetratricopeptide repeat protein n=1 Tax=Desulfosporosinus sp. Sb-LF TaxID=2560027 RepID=UPI00107FA33A|nr:tetratricopeptide repeat protein [Desulfosporosinus sp. Sb-LF]TGE32320.1 tetratricopeptide repeat protein [Desulfosporosinus sp. Sb-LF]